jgi:hypothetical protein
VFDTLIDILCVLFGAASDALIDANPAVSEAATATQATDAVVLRKGYATDDLYDA